ncbi:MAG: hypothetical protein RR909_01085 [Bacilli bacterium]
MIKLLKSKTLYLTLLMAINVSFLISLCVITVNKESKVPDFIGSTQTFEPTAKNRYIVNSKDFTSYTKFDAKITENKDLYSTISLDTTNVKIGQKIMKNDKIGSLNGEDVLSSYDSLCLKVYEENGITKIVNYNYNCFTISINFSMYDYYQNSLEKPDSLFLELLGYFYKVQFNGYNFDSFEKDGIVICSFIPFDCDSLINKDSKCSIDIVKHKYLNHNYLAASLFNNSICSKLFFISSNNKVISIFVDCVLIIDEYALIECYNHPLESGSYLYLYE